MDMFPSCPPPRSPGDRILLAHGEGARLTRRLVRDVLLEAFDNEFLRHLGDSAVLPNLEGRAVLTIDGYVVSPIVFPGGDIGTPANLIDPGKRMLSSMTPTMVVKDGKTVLLTGSPGGRTIINTVLSIVLAFTEYGMNGRQAVDAAVPGTEVAVR